MPRVFGLCLCVASSFTLTPITATTLNWFRSTIDMLDPAAPFEIAGTGSVSGQLSAGAVYRHIDNKPPVVLKGRRDSYGDFYLSVSYEVGTQGRRRWKQIAGLTLPEVPITVRIDGTNPKALVRVDMEPFRSSIGKFRWGRVVGPNGETAEIMLEDLLPTPESRDASGNFKKDITDPNPTRFGSLFALVSLTSFSKQLVGDFVFYAPQGTFAEIKGTESADEEFWPVVVLQCGNEDGKWDTVGRSSKSGKMTMLKLSSEESLRRIHVPLDAYKGCQGRFKYGRVIFPDNEIAAVFQISDLEPRSGN